MPDSYKPGQRQPQYGQNHKISDERFAWVQCEAGKFLILVGEDKGHGTDVVLYHPRAGRQPDVAIKLTDLTIHELTALSDLINEAMSWARPVVEQRDKEAEDAWNQGDDSHSRNYRPAPTVVYRKRPQSQHGQGVHDRSVRVPQVGGGSDEGDRPRRVRGTVDGVAEHESGETVTQDDSTPPD